MVSVTEHWKEQVLEPEQVLDPAVHFAASETVGIPALDAELDRLNAEIARVAARIAESRRTLVAITGPDQ